MDPIVALLPENLVPADEVQQGHYLTAIMGGATPAEAANVAGCSQLEVYLARHADERFNHMVQIAQLAQREQIQAEVIRKALVASGHVVEMALTDDAGDPILDEDFEPVKGLRLVNSNSSILTKLVERLLASSDKPAAPVQINMNQVNNTRTDKGEWILVTPDEEPEDGS